MRKLFLSIVAAALVILSSPVLAYTTISESFESSFPGSYFFQSKINPGCSTTFNQWSRLEYEDGLPSGGTYYAQHYGGTYDYPGLNDNIDMILSNGTQDNANGYFQYDFYVSPTITGGGTHAIGMISMKEVSDTCSGAAHVHDGNHMKFYAVIAGNFGDADKGFNDKMGFVVERSLSDGTNRCVDLYPDTFIEYKDGSGHFPSGWYQVRITRHTTFFSKYYTYVAKRWTGSWTTIGSKTIDESALSATGNCNGTDQPSMSTSLIGNGRIGFASYWTASTYVLLDAIVQNWAH